MANNIGKLIENGCGLKRIDCTTAHRLNDNNDSES